MAIGMPIVEDKERDEEAAAEGVNGAVNYALRFQDAPQDLAGSSSRTFLGVQIQCAQCHDHKTEKWKQDDFRKFASAFLHQRLKPVDQGKMGGEIKRIDLLDFGKVMPRVAANPDTVEISRAKATALDGTDLEKGEDTRRGPRRVDDEQRQSVVREGDRQSNVGAFSRARLHRSGGRHSPVEPRNDAGLARRDGARLRRARV